MKTFLQTILLAMGMIQISAANVGVFNVGYDNDISIIRLDVVPNSIGAKAEVLGLEVGFNGQKALLFTGEAAQKIANTAGIGIDAAGEMIVATGREIDNGVTFLANGAVNTGKTVLIKSKQATDWGIGTVSNAVLFGKVVAVDSYQLASDATTRVVAGLSKSMDMPVKVVQNTGTAVHNIGSSVLGGAARIACNLFMFVTFNDVENCKK